MDGFAGLPLRGPLGGTGRSRVKALTQRTVDDIIAGLSRWFGVGSVMVDTLGDVERQRVPLRYDDVAEDRTQRHPARSVTGALSGR